MNVLESRFSLFVAFPRRQSRAKESLSCEIIATPSQANPDEIINVVSCRRAGNTSALRLASFARVTDGRVVVRSKRLGARGCRPGAG